MITEITHTSLWSECKDFIKDNVTESIFHTWFTPIVPLKFEEGDFTIQVPSPFFYEYLEEKYAGLIHAAISRITGKSVNLKYRIVVDKTNGTAGETTLAGGKSIQTSDKGSAGSVKLNETPTALTRNLSNDWESNLNKKLTFDNFYEGVSNKLTRTVGESVSLNPDKNTFSPFFIFGCSGVGKTHLCHAIGNRIVELNPKKKVIYISSHLFQVQFTDASRKNVQNDFMAFYQDLDVLIIDDVHELAGKTATQNAYFHIFNNLHLLGKQIIITADKAPKDILGLEERLISRFNCGMVAELQKPDRELRHKILTNKVKENGLDISEEIIDYIAENACDHIRDLEGILTSLMAHALVYNKEVDLDLAKRVISKIIKQEKKVITIEGIQDLVSTYFKIDIKDIHSKSRKREIVQARQVTMYLSKRHTEHSYSHIGALVGNRDHATVLHACKMITNAIEVDKSFRSTMSEIETMLTR